MTADNLATHVIERSKMPNPSPKARTPGKREFLMRQLFDAFSWFDESLQQSMQVAGVPALSRSQSMVMVYLGEGIRRPSALARKMRVTRQAMHKTIADLQEKGYVQLVTDPDELRAKIVQLSPTGLQHHRKAIACLTALEKELDARLGRQTVTGLVKALRTDWGELSIQAAGQD